MSSIVRLIAHFLLTATSNAAPDIAFVSTGFESNISVLANDSFEANTIPRVTISAGPAYGTARVEQDGSISYSSIANYAGNDTITYQLDDLSASSVHTSTSSVKISVLTPRILYVSPTGDDNNSGATIDAPLQSLAGARNRVRVLRADTNPLTNINHKRVEVLFADGLYSSANPVQFSSVDNGQCDSNGYGAYPVTYRSMNRYPTGFNWNRGDDWRTGVNGTSSQTRDFYDNHTWNSEYTANSGGLTSSKPWFKTTRTDLSWVSSWYGQSGVYALNQTHGAMINQTSLTHPLNAADVGQVPISTWSNPTQRNLVVTVSGSLRLDLSNASPGASADVVVAIEKANGSYRTLFSSHEAKSQTFDLNLSGEAIGATEKILVSVRGSGSSTGWVWLHDQLTISTVDETNGAVITSNQILSGLNWETYKTFNGGQSSYVAKLSGVENPEFNSLFVNGRRAIRAREPDVGFFSINAVNVSGDFRYKFPTDNTGFKFSLGDLRASNRIGSPDMQIVNQVRWGENRMVVNSIDDAHQIVTVAGSTGGNTSLSYAFDFGIFGNTDGAEPGTWKSDGTTRYYAENYLQGFDQPGEWFYDRTNKLLYYYPLPGEDIKRIQLAIPRAQTLMELNGVADNQFVGLSFVGTDWKMNSLHGVVASQGAVGVSIGSHAASPAVVVNWSYRVVFDRNVFRGNGYYGLQLTGSNAGTSSFDQVTRNEFTDNGGGGVLVGYDADVASEALVSHSNRIALNRIHKNGKVWGEATGIQVGINHHIEIAYNKVYDMPYTGISVGWTWSKDLKPQHDNRVVGNDVSKVMQMLCDGAGIYINGNQPGTVVMGNNVRDIDFTTQHLYRRSPAQSGLAGIYLDNGASKITVGGNTISNTSMGINLNDTGPGVLVIGNVVVNPSFASLVISNSGDPNPMVTQNIFAWDHAPSVPVLLYSLPSYKPGLVYAGGFTKNTVVYPPSATEQSLFPKVDGNIVGLRFMKSIGLDSGSVQTGTLVPEAASPGLTIFKDWLNRDYRISKLPSEPNLSLLYARWLLY